MPSDEVSPLNAKTIIKNFINPVTDRNSVCLTGKTAEKPGKEADFGEGYYI